MITRQRVVGAFFVAISFGQWTSAADNAGASDAFPWNAKHLVRIELTLSAEEYQAMQPPPGGGFPGAPPVQAAPPIPLGKDGKPRETFRNQFGTTFPWAEGSLRLGDAAVPDVRIRYAGDGSYSAASGLKRSFRVERRTTADGAAWKALNLHCGSLDPSQGREWLALTFCQASGVAAPRAALAEVLLTVPGQFEKELLGLYTLVEEVDEAFVESRWGKGGLLLKPARMRGLDYLGDDWSRYAASYQPTSEPTSAQKQKLIAFARLINEADDETFRRQIDRYLDVGAFLKYLAANALLSNLSSFMSLGTNYSLCLPPDGVDKGGKFLFVPHDMELALANFLLMGSAEQLMKLNIRRPYPGENKLADRLLADPTVAQKYERLVQQLSETTFSKERLLALVESFEEQSRDVIERESSAARQRAARAGVPALAPSAGIFGVPPDLRMFVNRRTTSVQSQLAGLSDGYIPQFSFGPPPSGPRQPASDKPLSDATIGEFVQAPKGFRVTLFAAPPQVSYPVAVSAAPNGDIYVAVDEQGSLGRNPGGGKVLRLVDRDGDGRAEDVNLFASMEHPRGVVALDGAVWVLHPPLLSLFHDDDRDGKSDRQEVLVTGLTTELIDTRGGDHTTNGIRLGLDGWIYIAVGDYGIREAKGTDGATISSRGGCIARVRPDGTELEIFAKGFRNPFAIAIDHQLNLFTRDNTNDGGGWDVRVSQIIGGGEYGYTQLYANFTDEIMPALGAYGGGGGTGALFLSAPGWPDGHNDALYTGDWGRSEVYRHRLTPQGASFEIDQEVFLTIPRPTGMDIDASGRLIVASWRGGEASVFIGPQVGFLAAVVPEGWKPKKPVDYRRLTTSQLVELLGSPLPSVPLFAQRELLRRGPSSEATEQVGKLAADVSAPIAARTAAIFTLTELDGADSHEAIWKLAADDRLREFVLRAVTDRKSHLAGVSSAPLIEALSDRSARAQAQAIRGLVRLGDASCAEKLIPLTSRTAAPPQPPEGSPSQNVPDPLRVIPHLATGALVELGAAEACLAALDGPHAEGALMALRRMHKPEVTEGLIKKLAVTYSPELRRGILTALIRLYHREADYDGGWWGIRPDNTGPYYDPQTWSASERIGNVIAIAYRDADPATAEFLRKQLARHQVYFKGLPTRAELAAAAPAEAEKPIAIVKADPDNPDQVGNMEFETAVEKTLALTASAQAGKELFGSLSCRACHTDADGQAPKGPHLVDIGKRYKGLELVESILRPSAKIAQGFESYAFQLADGRVVTGFVVQESAQSVRIRDLTGVQQEFAQEEIEERQRQTQSAMPQGIADSLTPPQLADLVAYLQSL